MGMMFVSYSWILYDKWILMKKVWFKLYACDEILLNDYVKKKTQMSQFVSWMLVLMDDACKARPLVRK